MIDCLIDYQMNDLIYNYLPYVGFVLVRFREAGWFIY